MKTKLHTEWTVADICDGFVYNELEGKDADHVAAWSKGGATTIENCQMLCKHQNRAKGNR